MRVGGTLRIAAFAAVGMLALAGCEKKPPATPTPPPPVVSAWAALVNDWVESDFKAEPLNGAYQGRHEYDGLFPDWSDAGLAAEAQRLKDWRAKVEAVDPATLTAGADQFERSYLLSIIADRLFWIEDADWPHRNPSYYYFDPGMYLDRPYADLATRMKAYTKWASNIPNAAVQIKANLKAPLPKAYIDIGSHTFGPMGKFLQEDVVKVFAGAGDATAQAEFKKQNDAAAAALADLDTYLTTLRATQTDQFALGPDLFAKMLLMTEGVDTPLAELERVGRADLDRNKRALQEACKQYAPGKSIVQCVAKMGEDKPANGDAVGEATAQLASLKAYVIDHGLVEIPGTEEAKVKQSPPYQAQNSAYIDIPGPFEKNMPSYFNVAAPDPSWTKEKRDAYIPGKSDLLFTSVHEVWPGHFLQFLHSNRAASPLGRIYVGSGFAEGWAHYAEELMWEVGMGEGSAEVHIGQLSNATLRNVRFLSAIGMHTQGMTPEQSRRMFIDEGYQDEGNAEQQAARGTYDPGYLIYTMGKLQIRRLRSDWCEKRTGADNQLCWSQFHNAFLSYGGPPIPLVRGAMLNEPAKSAF
jgi:hypothetical protein